MRVWIGASDEETEGEWLWVVDDSPLVPNPMSGTDWQ